jgi:hypothetical protein
MKIFLRRSGEIIGTFNRKDYLDLVNQGNVKLNDEWTPVSKKNWQTVSIKTPFTRMSGAQIKRIVAAGNITLWSWRIIARDNASEEQFKECLFGSKRVFIEEFAISNFGAFSNAQIINPFYIHKPNTRSITELTTVWFGGPATGKTTIGLALEMLRDVALGKKISPQSLNYIHSGSTAEVRVDFRTCDGLKVAKLRVSRNHATLEASRETVANLKRIKFFEDYRLKDIETISPKNKEKIAALMSRARLFMPKLQWSGEGAEAWSAMHEALVLSGGEAERIGFSLLCRLHNAETNGEILILENPLGRLGHAPGKHLLKLLQAAPRRGATQVMLLETHDLSFYQDSP